jgi:hypothetical protein
VCTEDECDGAGNCAHPAGNAGTICRAATPGEVCDVDETCDGLSTACPPDLVEPNTTVCRADAGDCDVVEMCNGVGKFCPPDGFETSGTPCTSDGQVCTVDQCDGGGTCTHPAGNAGTECRASTGECDVAEQCNGSSTSCPADGFVASGTPCTSDGQVCTVDECDGAGACTHPAGNAGTECRASTGECDVAENCDGLSGSCPADGFVADGDPCTNDGMFCTGIETCQGGSCTGSGDPCLIGSCDEIANECVGCAVAPQAGCRAANKAIFLVKDNSSDDSKDKVIFKWIKGVLQVDKTDFEDPKTTADYNLCVYSGLTEDLIAEALVPPSATLWSEKTNGYKYKDTDGTQFGIQKIILKAGAAGKGKALLKGKGMGVPDLPLASNSSLDIDLPVRVQLVNTDNSECFEGTFDTGDIKKNEPGKFKGKAQ